MAPSQFTKPSVRSKLETYAFFREEVGWPTVPLDGVRWVSRLNRLVCMAHGEGCRGGSHGKHPQFDLVGSWRDASLDEDQHREWAAVQRGGIGVVPLTGMVVDADDYASGVALVKEWQVRYGLKLDSWWLTARGFHGPLLLPAEVLADPRLSNSTVGLGSPPSMEFRVGDRGYVVVPETLHVSGKQYKWVRRRGIAVASDKFVEALLSRPRRMSPAALVPGPPVRAEDTRQGLACLKANVREVAAAVEGTRNHMLNRCAFKVGFRACGPGLLTVETAQARLLWAADQCGLEDWEAEPLIERALEEGMEAAWQG